MFRTDLFTTFPSMRMRSTSVVLQVRLSESRWERYSAEASAAGVPLSTYIRQRLEREDGIADQIAELRCVVEHGAEARRSETCEPAPAAVDRAVSLESLLLLRQLATPQKTSIAQGELERRGITPWR